MYLDDLGRRIFHKLDPRPTIPAEEVLLYRLYGALALSHGEQVTAEQVHDAWAAWCAVDRPWHTALVPFAELSEAVQALDQPYVDAIRAVARKGLG